MPSALRYELAHNPGMFPNLTHPLETAIFQHLNSTAEQKPTLCLASRSHFRYRFHKSAALFRNLSERTIQRHAGYPLPAMAFVYKNARNPPVRQWRRVLIVLAPMLKVREFVDIAPLAPPLCKAIFIYHKRMVGTSGPDSFLLNRPVAHTLKAAFRMETDAPAAAVDAVVTLNQLSELVPGADRKSVV